MKLEEYASQSTQPHEPNDENDPFNLRPAHTIKASEILESTLSHCDRFFSDSGQL